MIGRFQQMNEYMPGLLFETPDLEGQWGVLGDGSSYVLYKDEGKHVRFLEFRPGSDSLALYRSREWRRSPKNDNCYTLTSPYRSYNLRMPTKFSQDLRNAVRQKPQDA